MSTEHKVKTSFRRRPQLASMMTMMSEVTSMKSEKTIKVAIRTCKIDTRQKIDRAAEWAVIREVPIRERTDLAQVFISLY
jgi:hypothetical protein